MSKGSKKIGLLIRERIVQDLKVNLTQAKGCFFIGFNKVNAFAFNRLRNDLTKSGAKVFVAKNSLFRLAFKDLNWQPKEEILHQETGAVCVYEDDIVKTCKILVNFAKESEILKIKGASIEKKPITTSEVEVLAKLPSRDVLLSMAVSGLAAPISGFVGCLNQIISKFVWVVEGISKKKEE